jgi:hypothetical protein
VALHDDFLAFNLSDLIIDIDLGYEFISDPPIIADLGFLNLTMEKLDLAFNLTTYYEDYNMTLNVTGVKAHIDDFDMGLDGVNDFLFVASSWINRVF